MDQKQILIIDDDTRVLHYLKQGLVALGDGYKITIASSADEALTTMKTVKPDLVLTDYRMPNMNGLELLKQVHSSHPNTRLIVMTAYGTDEVQQQAESLGVYRFLIKPFSMENLLTIINSALNENSNINVGHDGVLIIPEPCLVECREVLQKLRTELRPELALMGDMAGHIVTHVGTTMGLDLNSIIALVAGNFATASELDRIFDRARIMEDNDEDADGPMYITYLEGRNYDCYSANVSDKLFFTVIFNRQDRKNKAGMVWLHMRRTFRELQQIVASYMSTSPGRVMTDTTETVSQEFEKLFKSELEKKL